MRRGFLFGAVLVAGAVAMAGACGASAATADHAAVGHAPANTKIIRLSARPGSSASQKMTLALNKAAIVQLDTDARDVLVSNPAIVDAVVRSPRRIFLLGQKAGETNAFFFDAAGHQILSLNIRVERDVSDLQALINSDLSDASVKVSSLNDSVVLTGTVANNLASTRAQDLASRFVGDPKKVVNMLTIAAKEQVMLKVRIAEMQRQVAKQFGIDLATAGIVNGVPIVASTSNPFGLVGRALSDLSGSQIGQVCANGNLPLAGGTCSIRNNMQAGLRALETVGLLHTLAEPNLTAVSGETAKFLAGGEFPVPASRDRDGNVTVTFKKFGVGLSFTPVVMSEDRISLQISTEVSELTNTGAFTLQGGTSTDSDGNVTTVGGLTIPALAVRRAETTVELPSGGSFAIAGLLQHTSKQEIDRFPGLGSMPVLGALFRSRDFQNNETELVVLVSAYLVSPTSERKLAAPTDGFIAPSDAQTIFMGRLNTLYKAKKPETVKSAANDAGGYIVK